MPLKFYVFAIVFLVVGLLVASCTRRADLQREFIGYAGLSERANAIEILLKSNKINITDDEQVVVDESTDKIRGFIDAWEDFVTIADPNANDYKKLVLWHGKGSYSYKQIFHIYTNPINWNSLNLKNQHILTQFHKDILDAEQDSLEIHKDYERTEIYLERLSQIIEVFKVVKGLL